MASKPPKGHVPGHIQMPMSLRNHPKLFLRSMCFYALLHPLSQLTPKVSHWLTKIWLFFPSLSSNISASEMFTEFWFVQKKRPSFALPNCKKFVTITSKVSEILTLKVGTCEKFMTSQTLTDHNSSSTAGFCLKLGWQVGPSFPLPNCIKPYRNPESISETPSISWDHRGGTCCQIIFKTASAAFCLRYHLSNDCTSAAHLKNWPKHVWLGRKKGFYFDAHNTKIKHQIFSKLPVHVYRKENPQTPTTPTTTLQVYVRYSTFCERTYSVWPACPFKFHTVPDYFPSFPGGSNLIQWFPGILITFSKHNLFKPCKGHMSLAGFWP